MVATLAIAGLLLAGGVAATLSRVDVRRTGSNDVVVQAPVDELRGSHLVCQDAERIPAGTGAIRVSAVREGGPAAIGVDVLGTDAGRLARGSAPARSFNATVVRLRPHVAADAAGSVCVHVRTQRPGASVLLFGEATDRAPHATEGGRLLSGRIRIEYLRPSGESWWAWAPTVADRVAIGHAWSGAPVALLAALLALAAIGGAAWLLVRTS